MRTLILSSTRRESFAYAASEGIRGREVTHAGSAESLRGAYFATVIELPSYSERRDKHAINAELRQHERRYAKARGVEHVRIEDWVFTRPLPQIEGELPGQMTIDDIKVEWKDPAPRKIADSGNAPIPPAAKKADKPKPAPKKRPAKKAATPPPPASNTLEPEVELDFWGDPVKP